MWGLRRLCRGSYRRLLGHRPGNQSQAAPWRVAAQEGTEQNQQLRLASWVTEPLGGSPPAPSLALKVRLAAPQPAAGCTCVRDCKADLPR